MVKGPDKECAAKAIRIANSKFMEVTMSKPETLKLKRAALCFTDHDAFARTGKAEDGAVRKLSMVAYSGKIIKGHWYWGDLAIDTSGIKMSKKEIPILEDHETSRKIGFGSFIVNEQHQVVPRDSTFLDTPFAQEFIKNSDQGFPYEASIYARPVKIQRLMEKEETEVNGFKMVGPGTVWREAQLKECSICTFGADSNTKSAAMSEDEEVALSIEELQLTENEEVNMDLEKLKAEFPEIYAQAVALGKTEAEKAFVPVKAALDTEITGLKAEKEKLATDNSKLSERMAGLEKKEILRTEKEIKTSADGIFDKKVANFPERLRPKIRKQLNHQSFVKDDRLDEVAWSAAIDVELKDWVAAEGEETPAIIGMSVVTESEGVDVDNTVKRMLGHAGQTVQ